MEILVLLLPLILFPVLFLFIIGFIIYFLVSQHKKRSALNKDIADYANRKSFGLMQSTTWKPGGSYSDGNVTNLIEGKLPKSNLKFWHYHQAEVRGSGDSRTIYNRSVLLVKVPVSHAHFIINSKLNNNQKHGGNLGAYLRSQTLKLEGDFSQYFDVLRPNDSGANILEILTPNAMDFTLRNLHEYDIEIDNDLIFFYLYSHVNSSDIEKLLPIADRFIKLTRLSASRKSQALATNNLRKVIPGDADTEHDKPNLRKSPKELFKIIAMVLLIFPLNLLVYSLMRKLDNPVYIFIVPAFTIMILSFARWKHNKLRTKHQERYGKK